jgi:hypothetical protein
MRAGGWGYKASRPIKKETEGKKRMTCCCSAETPAADLVAMHHCRLFRRLLEGDAEPDGPALYLSEFSSWASGSSVLRKPRRALLIASVVPIIGLSTAIGNALTTDRVGPCDSGKKSVNIPSISLARNGT